MKWILGFIGKRLDGYKTKIGGVGLILSGIVGIINVMFPDTVPFPEMTIEAAITNIGGGFAVLGIGGKLDKNTAAVEASGGNSEPNIVTGSKQTIASPELTEEQRDVLNR